MQNETPSRNKAFRDLTGQRFGRWKVLRPEKQMDGGRRRTGWVCRCSCRAIRWILPSSLHRGLTTSCGCGNVQHGLTKDGKRHPVHLAWTQMLTRARNQKARSWKNYGGRGIKVCKRWLTAKNFIKDMLPSWKPGLSLERVNNNGHYSPANCVWATRVQQNDNKRSTWRTETPSGIMSLKRAAQKYGIVDYTTARYRIRRGMDPMTALTTPAWKVPRVYRTDSARKKKKNVPVEVPEDFKPPLVVSYGMGTDSTAVLCVFHEQGIRPDLIIFADVGSPEDPNEKPETYAYLPVIQEWLAKVGFPPVTVVRNADASKYRSLLDNCERQNMLPSLAYGGHSCQAKWKVAAMEKFMNSWIPAQITWARKLQVRRVIGYDASPADMRRCKISETPKYKYWYPLRDAGITRPECMKIIERNGLPQPGKSACFFCPASKRHEVEDLATRLPDLCARALRLELKAELLRGFKSTKGLGRNWNWREHLASAGLLAGLTANHDTGMALLAGRALGMETT